MESKQPSDENSTITNILRTDEIRLEKCLFAVGSCSAIGGLALYKVIENLQNENHTGAAVYAVLSLIPVHQLIGWSRYAISHYGNNKPQNL